MGLFRKEKLSPEELKTKLSIAQSKLEKREKQLKSKQDQARDEAKKSLRSGDERGFRTTSRRYSMLQGQTTAIVNMVEMSTSMTDMVEMQEGLKDVVEIGTELMKYQDKMGIDNEQLEKAVTNVRVSMEKLNTASEMISNTMDAMATGSVEATEAQESLRAELMAELKGEEAVTTELEEKIKKEQKQNE